MRTFRQKFSKSLYFIILIVFYILSAVLIYPTILTLDCPKDVVLGGVLLYSLLVIAYTIRALFACCYITMTNTEIIFINPYIRFYRKFPFSGIARAKIESGGIYADKYILIWDEKGHRFYKEIALVDNNDLKEIVELFNNHGIEVEKDIWKGYFK